jgi:hypothetical protein
LEVFSCAGAISLAVFLYENFQAHVGNHIYFSLLKTMPIRVSIFGDS